MHHIFWFGQPRKTLALMAVLFKDSPIIFSVAESAQKEDDAPIMRPLNMIFHPTS
jgi:hypothetical protein